MASDVPAQSALPPLPAGTRKPHHQTTFQMRGNEMPVGLIDGGTLHRGFALRPFDANVEKALARKRRDHQRSPRPASVVVDLLMELLVQLGPYEFATLSDAAKQLLVSRLYMCDALYIYFCARIEALGDMLSLQVKCPACRHKWKFTGDISLCDVKAVDSVDSICWEHTFKHGLPLRDGSRAMTAVLQPPMWSALTSARGKVDIASAKLMMIRSAIRQMGDGSEAPTPATFDGMSKWDIEHVSKSLDDNVPGPDLVLEPVCSECEEKIKVPMSWDFDFFFSSASL